MASLVVHWEIVALADGHLGRRIRVGDAPGVVLYVQIRDLRASLALAVQLGGVLVTEPFGVPAGPTVAAVGEPEGSQLVLVQQ